MNTPNILTVIRFILIPFFAFFLFNRQYYPAVSVFLLGGLTDVLDGYIARRYNLITSWGKLADPLADKLMQITALVLLAFQHKIPAAILAIVAVKEALMGLGSVILYKQKNYVVSANWYGKAATVIFYFAIVMVLVKASFSDVFIIIAVLSTLFALLMYTISYIKVKRMTTKSTAE